MIPGINILALAQSVQKKQNFIHKKYIGKTTNAAGRDVPQYEQSNLSGSIQAVPRKSYSSMGLDFAKKYITVWVTQDLKQLERGKGNDRIIWNNEEYEITDSSDWHPIDGWDQALCVRI